MQARLPPYNKSTATLPPAKGFTLVEALVAMAIFAIAASGFFYSVLYFSHSNIDSANNYGALQTAITSWATSSGQSPTGPTISTLSFQQPVVVNMTTTGSTTSATESIVVAINTSAGLNYGGNAFYGWTKAATQ